MPKKNYIIYCDESSSRDRYFSNFYGGVIIDASYQEAINDHLNGVKESLNFFAEIKWTKITENYAEKYIQFIDKYFDLIEAGHIKCRIMFTQNYNQPVGLTDEQRDNEYYLLYYQFLKHAFGLMHCNSQNLDKISVAVYYDQYPDTDEKRNAFRKNIASLSNLKAFKESDVNIDLQDITEIDSSKHVILQGLDIILGGVNFRLNDKHKDKPAGQRLRGKRTVAKERVYKHINKRIRALHPGFNVGVSTGRPNGDGDGWEHPYRHWLFKSAKTVRDPKFVKGK